MGFAGISAGTVFEGEKQFDLVIRFDGEHREDIQDIETASIQLPNGSQLPLSEFASISYTKGPAKISRDNTKRRIVVGVNVRNRDLESVVNDVQKKIQKEVNLPTGYTIEYGGQFENLRTAKERLIIAVPIALILIFILLYFAFDSVKEALIIYSAIPMSAVGGVILLYIRDLPFSISAGVGFIALFGIAVLNGIVLIEEFKELKAHGITDINERILLGTKNRLRPVLLTASAAALGFLPMAISTSAGAEVQRPLATVVVGGLISATALTLVVLPVLYAIFDRKRNLQKVKVPMHSIILFFLIIIPVLGHSQYQKLTVDEAVEIAMQNNLGLKVSSQKVVHSKQMIGSAIDLDKTEIYFNRDNNNIAVNNLPLNVWGISQTIQFPTIYGTQKKILESRSQLANDQLLIDKYLVTKEVSKIYFEILYWQKMLANYEYLDSLYTSFMFAANKKFEQGESNYLEKLTAETKSKEVSLRLNQIKESIKKAYILLNQWIQSDTIYEISDIPLSRLKLIPLDTIDHPAIRYYSDARYLSQQELDLEKQKRLPDLNVSIFRGSNNGIGQQSYFGFEVGLAIPLSFGAQKSRINASKTKMTIIATEKENNKLLLASRYEALQSDLRKYEEEINYFQLTGAELAEKTLYHAVKAFENGEIDFLQYTQLLENAKSIETNYLTSLFQYNSTVLEANYLIN
jgi:cobalt-zinc-cadmium resistance protein CzcA